MKSWVTVPNFKREYFKLLNGENFTSPWIALQRPYTLIISREKNFISEFWVRAKLAISQPDYIGVIPKDISMVGCALVCYSVLRSSCKNIKSAMVDIEY